MHIHINGQPAQINEETSVNEVLERFAAGSGDGVALAVNDQVIPRASWASHRFSDRDQVLIVRAVQGG